MSHIAKFCFFIEVHSLEPKWYEVSLTSEFQHISIDVEDAVPNYLTLAVESLNRCTQIILHDTVAVLLGELCHRGVAIAIVHPRYEVVVRLFAVVTGSSELISQHLWFL